MSAACINRVSPYASGRAVRGRVPDNRTYPQTGQVQILMPVFSRRAGTFYQSHGVVFCPQSAAANDAANATTSGVVMSTGRARRVADAIRGIKDFHATGRKLPPKASHREAYNQGTIQTAGEQLGLSAEAARQARQLADPAAGYTAAELQELCTLIKDTQPDQDDALPVFGKTHLIRLLSVPRPRRPVLQRAAVRGAWSTARLESEIAAKFGTRRDGGRKRQVPQDVVGLLVQLEGVCEGWRRLLAAADQPATEEKVGHAVLEDLPEGVRRQARAVGRVVAALQEAVTEELAERLPKRHVRQPFREAEDEGGGGTKAAAKRSGR